MLRSAQLIQTLLFMLVLQGYVLCAQPTPVTFCGGQQAAKGHQLAPAACMLLLRPDKSAFDEHIIFDFGKAVLYGDASAVSDFKSAYAHYGAGRFKKAMEAQFRITGN